MNYGTTPLFLEYFGLRRLEDLPAADELRKIVVQKPETLLTVDPGLATPPPQELKTERPNAAPEGQQTDAQPTSETPGEQQTEPPDAAASPEEPQKA
jgi:hypothetical protein